MGVFEDVQRDYPTLAFLFHDPEVGKLLRDAVHPWTGFSPQEFQARLYQTQWFRRRSQAQREFEILSHVDPKELQRRINRAKVKNRDVLAALGLKMPANLEKFLATLAVRDGTDQDPMSMIGLRGLVLGGTLKPYVDGAIVTEQNRARDIARGEYFVPLANKEMQRWGVDIALGLRKDEDLRAALSKRAANLYPHLKADIESGKTMAELFDGHRMIVAEELELDPDQVNLGFDKKWEKILRYTDPETKKSRALSLSETRTLARQDPRFWNTTNGKGMSYGLASFLTQKFGKVA